MSCTSCYLPVSHQQAYGCHFKLWRVLCSAHPINLKYCFVSNFSKQISGMQINYFVRGKSVELSDNWGLNLYLVKSHESTFVLTDSASHWFKLLLCKQFLQANMGIMQINHFVRGKSIDLVDNWRPNSNSVLRTMNLPLSWKETHIAGFIPHVSLTSSLEVCLVLSS